MAHPRLRLALPLLSAALCCGRPRAPSPEAEPIPWVDPSRCLSPCEGPGPERLVSIDDQGRLDPRGPSRLLAAAQPWLEAMLRAASAEGASLRVNGAHRTHDEQARLFAGAAEVGRFARPGHSEHEMGLAVDLDYPGETPPAFLAQRAHEFGFTTSYPRGKEHVTGFRAEPWHLRFVGPALASELRRRGLVLQEFLEANPARGLSGDCASCPSPLARSPCQGPTTPRCEGELLRWCVRGHEAAVDCSAQGASCGGVPPSCR